MNNEVSNGIDPMDPEHTKLGDVVGPVMAASAQPTHDNPFPPYDALMVPEGRSERKAMLDCLLDLFGVSLGFDEPAKATGPTVAEPAATELTEPTEPTKTEEIITALRSVMPDPVHDSEHFASFVQSRSHGILEILRLLVIFRNTVPAENRVSATVSVAKEIGAGHSVEGDGGPSPLNTFIPHVYNEVLRDRVNRVRSLIATETIKAHNAQLMPKVEKIYKDAGLSAALKGVLSAYGDNIGEFAPVANSLTPEYPTAQWFNNLLRALYNLDLSNAAEMHGILEELFQSLSTAGNVKTFAGVIDNLSNLARQQVEDRKRQVELDFSVKSLTLRLMKPRRLLSTKPF